MVFLSFFCMVFVLSISYPPALSLNQEGLALLSFKKLIQEDPEASLSNWIFSDENPCSWNGITCKDFKVISISIPHKGLLGFLPSVLGSLSNLRHIDLRSNKLHGSLPAELFDGWSTQSLVFYGNSSNGSLPTVGNLSYLQTLDLSDNFFNGSIPISILQCRRLKTLDLSRNNFTGTLPFGFGTSLIALEKLDLSYNQLNGSVPSDFGNLLSLQGTVDLSHNLFSGSIPTSLGNLPEKVYIDLTYNNLSGSIPQSGALVNRGPTAFIGNPGLCGPPLKNPCSADTNAAIPITLPYIPNNQLPVISDDNNRGGSSKGRRSLSSNAVIAIVVSDIVGIGLIAWLFLSCYWRAVRRNSKDDSGNSENGKTGEKACSCFGKDRSETTSENVEQLDLVALDSHVGFDLDELLKSPAFVLGKSGIGIMYKVVIDDGRTLAVRRLGGGGMQRFKEFRVEVETIGKVRHPNIITLRAYYWSADEKLLVYDYMPNGNLAAAIHGKAGMESFSPMPWLARLEIMKGIAKGLAYLHEFSPKKYVHGDLKSTNILLGPNMEPQISDFGLARLAKIAEESPAPQSNRIAAEKSPTQPSEVSAKPPTKLGRCYQAPEALKLQKPSQKWDVYSFGVILLELISGRSPMVVLGTPDMDLVRWVRTHIEEKKTLSEVLDPCLTQEPDREEQMASVMKIALSCVHASAERRPSMRHVSDALDGLSTNSQERPAE